MGYVEVVDGGGTGDGDGEWEKDEGGVLVVGWLPFGQ